MRVLLGLTGLVLSLLLSACSSAPVAGGAPPPMAVAAGHTPAEVAKDVQDKLAAFVREPQVAVILTDLRSNEYLSRVRVTGAVRQPVSVPYRQGMTLLDAVLAAGGLTEFAAPDRAVLYREIDNTTRAYPVRLDRVLEQGDLTTNYKVAPGDVITVPERVL